jgi:hypothetical protein
MERLLSMWGLALALGTIAFIAAVASRQRWLILSNGGLLRHTPERWPVSCLPRSRHETPAPPDRSEAARPATRLDAMRPALPVGTGHNCITPPERPLPLNEDRMTIRGVPAVALLVVACSSTSPASPSTETAGSTMDAQQNPTITLPSAASVPPGP